MLGNTPPQLHDYHDDLIPVDESRYHTLTEDEILEILLEKSISKADFQTLITDIKKSLNSST